MSSESGRYARPGLAWCLAAASIALGYLVPIALRPLFIPDEPRYAELAREMVATGDWIVPRLDGLRYFEKPPLQYWTTGGFMSLFGHSALAVRLTGALSIACTGWLLVRAARRAGIAAESRAWAGLVFASSMLAFAVGTLGVIDSLLTVLLTATLLLFFEWCRSDDRRTARRALAACGAAAGAAFLAKGFLAFAVPGLVGMVLISVEHRWSRLLGDLWVPLLTLLIVTTPWSIAIALREPDFWRYFLFEEHLARFAGDRAHHAEPAWFYLPVLLGGLFPWTALAPTVATGLSLTAERTRPTAERSFLRFLCIWTLVGLAFFSASRGKLPTYALPLLPPLALLIAIGVTRALRAGKCRSFDRSAGFIALVMAGAAVALPIVNASLARPPFEPRHRLHLAALCLALAWWAVSAYSAKRRSQPDTKLACFALGPLGLMLASSFALPSSTLDKKVPGRLLAAVGSEVGSDDLVLSDTNLVHAVTWELERSDVTVFGGLSELTYGISYPDSVHRAVDAEGARALLHSRAPGRAAFVFRKLYAPEVAGEFGEEPTRAWRSGMFLVQEFGAR